MPTRRSQTSAARRFALRSLVVLSLLVQPMLADWSSLPPVGTRGAGSSPGLATLGRTLSEALPSCSDNDGAFAALEAYTRELGYGSASCASALSLMGKVFGNDATTACALTIEELVTMSGLLGLSWEPPMGSESTDTLVTLCPESCATVGVHYAGCDYAPMLPPSPPSPPPSPPPPSLPPYPSQLNGSTIIRTVAELRSALAESQTVDAYLVPGTHIIGTFVAVHGKRLTLRSDGAVLDANGRSRHFVVQNLGTLELEGVRLQNGAGKVVGGAVLARHGTAVEMRDVSIENCVAVSNVDNGEARGGAIALGSGDGSRMLELVNGPGHIAEVNSVAWSPDGTKIVSGSSDSTLKIWDVNDVGAGAIATGTGHSNGVLSVAWSPDGTKIVSGSEDSTLKVWDLDYTNTLTLINVTISSCSAAVGGAISAQGPDPWMLDVRESTFVRNTASQDGGALSLSGVAGPARRFAADLHSLACAENNASAVGGALSASDCRFAIRNGVFERNTASDGAAIFYSSSTGTTSAISTIEASRFSGNWPDPVVQAAARIDWTCRPGQYMAQRGDVSGDFDGCLPCLAGYLGTATNLRTATCETQCPSGSYCPEGSSVPIPCQIGTYLPARGASSSETCSACSPGSYSDVLGNGRGCTACSAGR